MNGRKGRKTGVTDWPHTIQSTIGTPSTERRSISSGGWRRTGCPSGGIKEFVFPLAEGERWYLNVEMAETYPDYEVDSMLRKVEQDGPRDVPAGDFETCFQMTEVVGVGAVIVDERGRLFLARRGPEAKNERGLWEFPGGSVELGETLANAPKVRVLQREMREEYGVEIAVGDLLDVVDHGKKPYKEQYADNQRQESVSQRGQE